MLAPLSSFESDRRSNRVLQLAPRARRLPPIEAIEIHQCFPLSFGDMCTRTFGFAKDTGQFKGILKAVIHDVDELVYDEDAGGDVPLQFTIQRDFSKNEKRPLRWCDKEEELDLPPY